MDNKALARQELAKRELERRHKVEQEDFLSYVHHMFKYEKKKKFLDGWYHKVIAEKLEAVVRGDIKRLIINIPPRTGKSELITKLFPTWAMGKRPDLQVIATGYSTSLTQTFSNEARQYYKSNAYKMVFPRSSPLRDDQNTKEWWTNEEGGSYYATGTGGSITGRGANIFLIDDPIKPKDADSDITRVGINNWYSNTVMSRLNNMGEDSIIIIMQRTHENDLCGYLMEEMNEGIDEGWEIVSIPMIAEIEDEHRKEGESLHEERFPIEILKVMQQKDVVNFSCQYQQNPIAKESQEFHEEWFKYYDHIPAGGRTFTAVDPAFSKKKTADYTAIITGKFIGDVLYVLEITHGRFDPAELEDKVIYHARKWNSEKVGVEAFAAQSMIGFSLRNRFRKEVIRARVEDIRQSGSKESKIRRLISLYRNGQIFHNTDLSVVEQQLLKFPRGTHDDAIDALQMLYNLYELQPNVSISSAPVIKFDAQGLPFRA